MNNIYYYSFLITVTMLVNVILNDYNVVDINDFFFSDFKK